MKKAFAVKSFFVLLLLVAFAPLLVTAEDLADPLSQIDGAQLKAEDIQSLVKAINNPDPLTKALYSNIVVTLTSPAGASFKLETIKDKQILTVPAKSGLSVSYSYCKIGSRTQTATIAVSGSFTGKSGSLRCGEPCTKVSIAPSKEMNIQFSQQLPVQLNAPFALCNNGKCESVTFYIKNGELAVKTGSANVELPGFLAQLKPAQTAGITAAAQSQTALAFSTSATPTPKPQCSEVDGASSKIGELSKELQNIKDRIFGSGLRKQFTLTITAQENANAFRTRRNDDGSTSIDFTASPLRFEANAPSVVISNLLKITTKRYYWFYLLSSGQRGHFATLTVWNGDVKCKEDMSACDITFKKAAGTEETTFQLTPNLGAAADIGERIPVYNEKGEVAYVTIKGNKLAINERDLFAYLPANAFRKPA